MKIYLSQQVTIDRILEAYTRAVKHAALAVLAVLDENGFIGIDPRSDAPSTYKELANFWTQPERPKLFPVYSGGCENTVYDHEPMVNLLFRAWHDIEHCKLGVDFSMQGERTVGIRQADRLDSAINKRIMLADTVGQRAYYESHGEYVPNQRAFVIDSVFGSY